MDHYNKGDGLQNPWLDEDIQPLALTERNIDDVVAFLASLTTNDYKEPAAMELTRQRALSRTTRPQVRGLHTAHKCAVVETFQPPEAQLIKGWTSLHYSPIVMCD